MINHRFILLTFVAFAMAATSLFAGDPIPGIDVTLRNTENNKTMKSKTNRSGKFSFRNLEPGTYVVELSYKGQRMFVGKDRNESLVISPRDAASGLPTGKRQHRPLTVTKELDKASPKLAEAVCRSHNTTRSNRSSSSQDYNSSRSNNGSAGAAAQNHNSSRSNRTSAVSIRGSAGDSCSPVVEVKVTKNQIRGHVTVLK